MTDLDARMDFMRGPAMANRLMLAPLTNWQSNADGTLAEAEYKWLTLRAQGGFGLTMTCAAHVHASGKAFVGQLGIFSDDHLTGLTRLADGIRAAGSLSSVQLHHGGWRAPENLTGQQPMGPFADAATGARAMTTSEVEAMIEAFAAGARRAERAGFDGVELHGAHSYLICQFLDAGNDRSDGWGGDFAGRRRFLDAIIDAVRAVTGAQFQLGVRLSPERHGIPTAEARELAQSLMLGGKVDFIDMSLWDSFKTPIDPDHAARPLIEWFTDLERGQCRLGVAGKIMDAATAQRCLDAGADFVLIGRGAIIHHDFARQAAADPAWSVRPLPVSRNHLRQEGLSEPFIEGFAGMRAGFVEA